jgi:hypothetical protein
VYRDQAAYLVVVFVEKLGKDCFVAANSTQSENAPRNDIKITILGERKT